MKNKQTLPKSPSQYFSQLIANRHQQNQHQFNQFEQPLVYDRTLNIDQQAYHQIICGLVEFKEKPDLIEDILILPKKSKVSNDVDQIDKKIKQNQEMLKQAKRQMLLHKKREQEVMKIQHQIKMQENQQKTRQWAQKQKIYQKRRLQLVEKRQREMDQNQQRQKLQKQRKKQQQIQQRKKYLQQRLKQFQQSRKRRKQFYQQTLQQSKLIPEPKFKQIEKKFEQYLAQQKMKKQQAKKNIKMAKQLNFDLIKQHEKQYIEKLQQRMKQKGYSSLKSIKQEDKEIRESRFKNLLKRSQENIQEERQKFQRRISYQERLKQIQVQTDEDKKIKIQIARDKAKNPLKYNFLKQKNLNDYQIFMEFKDFILDIDRNQLGKEYLRESRKIGQQSRIKKSHSVSAISTKYQKNTGMTNERYQNYLPEIKAKRSAYDENNKLLTQRDVEEVAKRLGSKEKTLQKISKSLKKYDDTIVNKKIQLQSLNMISSTIKKQRQIDELYMKSLKAKLACLQISENK